jgi:hypothetical protein
LINRDLWLLARGTFVQHDILFKVDFLYSVNISLDKKCPSINEQDKKCPSINEQI